jgi:hypothetical protein
LNHFNNNLIINTKPKTKISVPVSHGDLAELDDGVDSEGYEVNEAVDGAANKVKSGVKVGHGGRSKGFHSGQITISDYDWDKLKKKSSFLGFGVGEI